MRIITSRTQVRYEGLIYEVTGIRQPTRWERGRFYDIKCGAEYIPNVPECDLEFISQDVVVPQYLRMVK